MIFCYFRTNSLCREACRFNAWMAHFTPHHLPNQINYDLEIISGESFTSYPFYKRFSLLFGRSPFLTLPHIERSGIFSVCTVLSVLSRSVGVVSRREPEFPLNSSKKASEVAKLFHSFTEMLKHEWKAAAWVFVRSGELCIWLRGWKRKEMSSP